ncbi:MAG: class I SAM-dependent methyltransferase [Verrucomicrobiae bacterium]|nr:class I SAM-dependent methyltransferase [Verrucomicrobiae bacterium]
MCDPTRTPEALRRHFEVERELAQRLRRSSRAERAALYQTLYAELFARVPDHPRLTRRADPERTRRAVEARLALLRPFLHPALTFLEIAPGDCALALALCPHVREVIAADISDQSAPAAHRPPNFRLLVYDGFHLDLPPQSVDLAFSYQCLEHLHPDDLPDHLQLIHRLLRPGGAYVLATPHRYSGPHDISAHFSDTPQGFHLHEYTYTELRAALLRHGFTRIRPYRAGRLRHHPLWDTLERGLEALFALFPRPWQRRLSRRLFQSVTVAAWK